MRGVSLLRQPPAGSPIGFAELWTLSRERYPERSLASLLEQRLGRSPVSFHASGREALRVALTRLAAQRERGEVLVPAYTCYSVPAAAVAAGLRVRLVDVGPRGQIDVERLRTAPLERAAALVVTNLFGVAEPVREARELLRDAGAALVDDAAQALGATSPDGAAGARGDLGVLSFGRGKPLSGLGGGALVGGAADGADAAPSARRGAALLRALAYDVARAPLVFRWLALVPFLHVGETSFDPAFRRGPIDGSALSLAAAALARFDDDARARAGRAAVLAERIEAETRFEPIRPGAGATGVFPRLALLAPTPRARDAALARLRDLGATLLYPASLDAVPGLRPHLADPSDCEGARSLAARLLTLPTHAGLAGARLERAVRALAESA
ncbi:MAG TPA: aminotransferase class V-fold PLP-dependent enzyme [Myxococcota bacterium]|nr:aminotransferase class V-fold PLP-dependent enzyme [Myxococcota bacterium]